MESLFYRNPRLLVLTICLIMVAGASSYSLLPRLEDPTLTQRFAVIKTIFPGASPDRVETLVTDVIEDELEEIEEIKTLESTSSAEISVVEIELNDNVYEDDVDEVWSRVRDKIADAEVKFPSGVLDSIYEDIEPRAFAMIVSLTWDLDQAPNYAILKRLAEQFEETIQRVPGTEQTELYGHPEEEVLVEVDPIKATAIGLTAQQITNQLAASDAKQKAGQIRSSSNDLLIEVDSEFETLEQIQETPLVSNQGAAFVRLGEIAKVHKGAKYPVSELALIAGKTGVMIGVLVEPSFRVDQWAAQAHERFAEFQTLVPEGVNAEILFDQSRYTVTRLNSLVTNLLLGGAAVLVVILFLMGWRSALLVGSALPLSALMVLSGMHYLGIPLHQMSVTGLIIALGLLIDNAIVVVDETRHRIHSGMSTVDAITDSVRHLAVPLLGSTLTTTFAFAPIALMPGPAGEFVGTIAVSVILSLFSSLFVSLTIVTALTGILVDPPGQKRWFQSGIEIGWLADGYHRLLQTIYRRPVLGVVTGVMIPFFGFWCGTQLQEQFFPAADRDQFQVEFELPPQSSLNQTTASVLHAREILKRHPAIEEVHWLIGRSIPPFYYNVLGNRELASNYSQAMVQLKTKENYFGVLHELQDELNEEFPESMVNVKQLEQGPPFNAPIEIRIFGPDPRKLREIGNEIRAILSSIEDVVHTRSELAFSLPKVGIQIDEEQARLTGLSHAAIAGQLHASLEGVQGGSLLEGTEELPVRVRMADEHRQQVSEVLSLDLTSPGSTAAGGRIPLDAVADVDLISQPASITRINGRRVNTVQGFIRSGVLPQDVLDRFLAKWDENIVTQWPGYSWKLGGESAERDTAIGNLMASVGILTVLMIATLVLSFSSFRMAGIIGAVGMLSVGLGLCALWVFGYPFGFMAIVGTMGLIGVAINDSIVVLAAIADDRKARAGDLTSMIAVVERCTRHVVATTLTTMAGFTPLMIEGGGFWPPLAVSIAGGVGGATILALIFVPSVYLLICCRSEPEAVMTEEQLPLSESQPASATKLAHA